MASSTLPKGALWMQNVNYPASWDRALIDALYASEGVIDGFAVTPDTGLTINVSAGRAIVTGDEVAGQGKYLVDSDAVVSLTVASVGADRTEYVMISIDDAAVAGGRAGNNVKIITSTTAPADSQLLIATLTLLNGTDTITSGMISDDRVFADVVAPSSITTAKLAADAVDGTKIADDAVDTEHIAAQAVGTTEIANAAVTTGKIGDSQVTTGKIGDDQVTNAKIGPAAVGTTEIGDDQVTQAKIGPGAVGTTELASSAVTNVKLGPDAVNGDKLADNAVNSEHYVDGSIDRVHLAPDIIDSTKLADNAVNSEHYVDGSIDRVHLAADIIDSTKIADSAVNAEHLNQFYQRVDRSALSDYTVTTTVTDIINGPNITANTGSIVMVACSLDVVWDTTTDNVGDLVSADLMIGAGNYPGEMICLPFVDASGGHRQVFSKTWLIKLAGNVSNASVDLRVKKLAVGGGTVTVNGSEHSCMEVFVLAT